MKRALLDAGYGQPVVPTKVHVELRSKVNLMIFDPSAAEGSGAGYELWIGEARSRAEVAEGRCEIVRGAADRPEATIETIQPPWPHWSTKAAPRGGVALRRPGDRGRRVGGSALPYPVPIARAGPTRRRGAGRSTGRPSSLVHL